MVGVLARSLRAAAGAAAVLVAAALPSLAEDEAPPPWTGRATVYGWLPALDLDLKARNSDRSRQISISKSDVLESLQFAAFATGALQRGRFGVVTDVVFSSLSSTEGTPGPLPLEVTADNQMLLWMLAGSWRLYESGTTFVDALGGGRLVYFDTSTKAQTRGPLPIGQSVSVNQTWVEPLVGVRVGAALTDKIGVRAVADVGGFGVGSELTWEAIAAITYAFTPHFLGELGFRYLSIDYQSDRLDTQLEMYGPALGVTYRF